MTWKQILDYCIGEVGLTPSEFWSMTFAEVDLACKGYETRMSRVKEVPRMIAAILLNVNRGKGKPAIRLEDVIGLYTDVKKDIKLITKEEVEQAQELSKKAIWQNSRQN